MKTLFIFTGGLLVGLLVGCVLTVYFTDPVLIQVKIEPCPKAQVVVQAGQKFFVEAKTRTLVYFED